jgi:toxin ParE1/3/4
MEIVWRAVALDGLEQARRYIAHDNPSAADGIFDQILWAVERLAEMPESGHPGRVEGTRELVVPGTPYLVAYAVIGGLLVVLAVQHSAQEWPHTF